MIDYDNQDIQDMVDEYFYDRFDKNLPYPEPLTEENFRLAGIILSDCSDRNYATACNYYNALCRDEQLKKEYDEGIGRLGE